MTLLFSDSRSVSAGGSGGRQEVPEKYLIVQNDSLVQVKYLLLYTELGPAAPRGLGRLTRDWLFQHRWWLLVLAYCALLVAVGLMNSQGFHFYLRRFSHYWGDHHSHYDET